MSLLAAWQAWILSHWSSWDVTPDMLDQSIHNGGLRKWPAVMYPNMHEVKKLGEACFWFVQGLLGRRGG